MEYYGELVKIHSERLPAVCHEFGLDQTVTDNKMRPNGQVATESHGLQLQGLESEYQQY